MKKTLINFILISILSLPLIGFSSTSVPKQLSTYYIAPSQEINTLIHKFKINGFSILSNSKILNNHTILTISNQELQNTNSYLATLQVNVNKKEIRIQNPSYLAAAYLGGDYHYGAFENTINALENVLGTLRNSPEKADFSSLANYRFMYGLPSKKDNLILKKGDKLIEDFSSSHAKEYILYSLKLPNGSILVGHRLQARTNEFLKLIGEEQNAQILPYEAIITEHKISIMNPKYYLALSLPLLSLQEFIAIASVPDEIIRNIKKAYK